jgi:Flp pilus assembly protein TadD
VDAGKFAAAGREIERELAGVRWKSSWLLLRARLAGRRGDFGRQMADAEAALAEIQPRLHRQSPDPHHLAECGMALGLLGRKEEARQQFAQARAFGILETTLEPMEREAFAPRRGDKPAE